MRKRKNHSEKVLKVNEIVKKVEKENLSKQIDEININKLIMINLDLFFFIY